MMLPKRIEIAPENPEADSRNAVRSKTDARTGLLEMLPEQSNARFTRLAECALDVPAAFLTLIDGDSDAHKAQAQAQSGQPFASERERASATLCQYAMQADAPLVIGDTMYDPAFAAVPAVASLGVRAYVGVPLRSPDGECVGSFCAIDMRPRQWSGRELKIVKDLADTALREISLRSATREAHRKAREALAQSREQERAFAHILHDLRTPLNVINMTLDIMEDVDAQTRREILQDAQRANETLNGMMDDLLRLSRMRSHELPLQRRQTEALQLLENVRKMIAPIAQQRDVQIRLCAVPRSECTISLDYKLVLRVLCNLVGNAVRYTPQGGEVRLSVRCDGERSVFTVSDDGPGLSAEDAERVFDRYWRKTPDEGQGLGLGLSVAKQIVEAHGGCIRVDSTPGHGATFLFSLPLNAPEDWRNL